jgi:hypothetical protein
MAGDIEGDSYGIIAFQAESVHSGSISFGRYEKEPLDWERRSSFSHNKYLEEVEKCLKPGSVTEKKAYLEAHFKRKGGILSPESTGSLSYRDYQNSESYHNGNVQRDEFDSIKEVTHTGRFHETGLENGNHSEECIYGNEDSQCESENLDYANYDESSEGWGYEGEYEVTEHERENNASTSSHKEPVLDKVVVVDSESEDVKNEERHQTQTESDRLPIKGCGSSVEVNHNFNNDGFNMDDSSYQHIDLSSQSYPAAESETATSENQSPKSWPATESKPNNHTSRTEVVNRSQSKIAPKTTTKTTQRMERESPDNRKKEKLALQTVSSTQISISRMPKAVVANNSKAKLNLVKEPRGKNLVCSQTSSVKKSETRANRENRSKQTVDSTKPDTKPSASPFSFKSSERAERRKEFYVKLEEKLHAKEAEMNSIQAKTQEKKDAEIKKLRRRLNFKASPMPSFYHSSLPAGSEVNKAGSSTSKSTKSRNMSTSPMSGSAAGRSPSFTKADSAYESVKGSVTTVPSESGSISSASPTKSNRSPETPRRTGITGKKLPEKQKEKLASTKDEKLKVGTRRTSNEMVRKSIKGISIGNSMAVGVAS